jgi:hypothetical protein
LFIEVTTGNLVGLLFLPSIAAGSLFEADASPYLHLQTVALELLSAYQCHPVFLGKDLKEEYYKGGVGTV